MGVPEIVAEPFAPVTEELAAGVLAGEFDELDDELSQPTN
jgi:hypothetical protein